MRAAVATFCCEFFLSYGMTECCGKIAMSLVDAAARAELGPAGTLDLVCSSGRPFFLLDVRVVAGSASAAPADEDDAADVARGAGAVGEVWIRAELESSTRLQCEHTRRFRRNLFCCASRTYNESNRFVQKSAESTSIRL